MIPIPKVDIQENLSHPHAVGATSLFQGPYENGSQQVSAEGALLFWHYQMLRRSTGGGHI